MIGIGIVALLAAAAAAEPAPAATTQALFDAASTAVDAGRCADAVRDFAVLEARPQVRRNAAVLAVIRMRKGRCLAAMGQVDAAATSLRDGLAAATDTPVYRNDIAQAHIALGRVAYARFDYPEATREFVAARAGLTGADRFEALVWLVRATMFDPGPDALAYADEALALARAPDVTKAVAADVKTLHARVLLNHGDQRAAYAELKQALEAEGGLTLKVNSAMIATRSDLALAALLNHDKDSARKYLAYTGAGHGTPFGSGATMAPPPCDDDLHPDDSAVVEFGIGSDGAVRYATPIYASRLGPMAVEFARAVADWSWQPEALKDIAPLFRAVTRVELRCSTASAKPAVLDALRGDLVSWLAGRGVAPFDATTSDAASVAPARAELARRRAAGNDAALVPVLVAIGRNPVVPPKERRDALIEARDIALRAGAPVAARTYLEIEWVETERTVRGPEALRDGLRVLLARPDIAVDPRSRSGLRLMIAEAYYQAPPPRDAVTLLHAVADDTALGERDALRTGARVRLASSLAQKGDLTGARDAYQLSGVNAQQCALVDARPALSAAGVGEKDFPRDALQWGFEGWVRVEFDVGADGHTANQRAIIAYPPFVFPDAAVGASRRWTYRQTYRPEGGAGCGGAQQQIKFQIAQRR